MYIRIVDKGSKDGITPHLDGLAEGPQALGCYKFAALEAETDSAVLYDMKEIQKITDRFHHVIAHFVVVAFGYTKMMALLKENKGCSV